MIEIRLPIIKWGRSYAEYGEMHAPFELSKTEIANLENAGFLVTMIAKAKIENLYLCDVDWSQPKGRLAERFFEIAQDAISISKWAWGKTQVTEQVIDVDNPTVIRQGCFLSIYVV